MRILPASVAGLAALASVAAAQPSIEALPAILQLQLDQRPAWRAYKDAAAEEAAERAQQASRATELNALPTPARLDALRQGLATQAKAFERQAAATEAFYAVLSPDQRRVFDAVTRLPTRRPHPSATPGADGVYARSPLRPPPPGAGLPPPG